MGWGGGGAQQIVALHDEPLVPPIINKYKHLFSSSILMLQIYKDCLPKRKTFSYKDIKTFKAL